MEEEEDVRATREGRKKAKEKIYTTHLADEPRPLAESGENYHHNFPRLDGRCGCKGGEQKKKKSNLKISLTSPVSLFILHEFLRASGRTIPFLPQHPLTLSRSSFVPPVFFLMNIKVVRDDEKLRTLERL